MDLKDSFDKIYENKMWTANNKFTLSGPGSELKSAKNCIKFLINFIKKHNIKKIKKNTRTILFIKITY